MTSLAQIGSNISVITPSNETSCVNNINAPFRTQCQDEKKMLEKLLSVSYGLSLTSYKRLGGYDDVNYHVRVSLDQHRNLSLRMGSPSVDGYVLRIFNAKDSQQPQRMEAIDALINHASQKGISTQTTVLNLHGQCISAWTFVNEDEEEVHVICLRSFVPGQTLENMMWTDAKFFKFGVFVAKVTQALKDFRHPFFETFQFSWSFDNLHHLKNTIHAVVDKEKRRLIEDVLESLSGELFRNKDRLEMGQVHGDLKADNVIFHSSGDFKGDFSGWHLIDFHDTHRSFSLVDLSISVSHLAQEKNAEYLSPPLDVIGHSIAGYNSVIPLGDVELEFVVLGLKTRLCCVLVNGYNQCLLKPGNEDYICHDFDSSWALLKEIHHMPTKDVLEKIKNMIKAWSV